MKLLLLLSSFLIILTKFLDVHSTLSRISSPEQERNIWVRQWMRKYGIKKVIWGIFLISVLIVGLSFYLVLKIYTEWYFQWLYVFMAIVISLSQLAVAHSNYMGKSNVFTRWLMKKKHYRF
ncbi:MAG: hypothetical protein M9958_13140 [Chitinophagales bacterium]|nr:hypothetical protein [Chitinophagales bacterium]